MAKIKLNGDTSGYIEISAPAVSGNNTLELGPGTKILTNLDNTFTGVSTFSNGIDVTGGNLDIGGATHSRNLTVHDATNSVILIEGASNGTSNLMFADENDEDVNENLNSLTTTGLQGLSYGVSSINVTLNVLLENQGNKTVITTSTLRWVENAIPYKYNLFKEEMTDVFCVQNKT